jgi:hypothetical protein
MSLSEFKEKDIGVRPYTLDNIGDGNNFLLEATLKAHELESYSLVIG